MNISVKQDLRSYQRSIIQIIEDGEKSKIIVDENELDIFQHSDLEIPVWQPRSGVKDFGELSYMALDIETTGLGNANGKHYINADFNAMGHKIKMIGIKTEAGEVILKGHDERRMLIQFIYILCKKAPYFLYTYNGYNFDIPFLIFKLEQHGVQHPFSMSKNPSKMSAAQMFGKPAVFHQYFLNWGNGKQTYIIDLYLGVLAWDFVARKLTSWSLKTVPVALGLREENDRVELSYNQMLVCYETNDWELMESYLKDDLEDTVRVANFIMPAFYYQSLVIPTFNPQQLFIYGNATKLNKFLVEHYGEHRNPETDEPYRFKGGRTEAFCGFYPNTVKVDVASLYPTIMLAYMITSYKDKDNILLGALNYLRDTRLHHKKRAKDKTISSDERLKSDRLQSAFKVVINSIYGFLGAKGIEYNDYEAAALVTAYGRAILKFMMEYTLGQGATIVNMDTDAVAYSSPPGKDREIYEGLVEALPDWIEIEWEWAADVFIPSTICLDNFNKNYKFDSYHGKNIVQKWFPEATNEDLALILTKFGQEKVTFKRFLDISKMLDMDFLTSEGLRKNYIVFVNGGDKVKLFGKYKKRDRSVLQKQFQVEYLRLFRTDKDAAEKYYYKVSDKIEKGLYPIKDLAITKKIRKGAKREIEYGLGQEGDIITSYQSVNGYSLIDSGDAYDIPAYMEELQSLYNEIHDALMIQELTDVR